MRQNYLHGGPQKDAIFSYILRFGYIVVLVLYTVSGKKSKPLDNIE